MRSTAGSMCLEVRLSRCVRRQTPRTRLRRRLRASTKASSQSKAQTPSPMLYRHVGLHCTRGAPSTTVRRLTGTRRPGLQPWRSSFSVSLMQRSPVSCSPRPVRRGQPTSRRPGASDPPPSAAQSRQTHTASPLTGRRAALSRIKGSGWTVTECDWSRAAFRRSIAARQCSMAQLLHDLPASGGRLPVCSTDHRTSSGPLLMAGSGSCRPGRSPLHLHCLCHTRWLPAPAPHRRQLWWERPAARGPSPERRGLSAAPMTSPESALETS